MRRGFVSTQRGLRGSCRTGNAMSCSGMALESCIPGRLSPKCRRLPCATSKSTSRAPPGRGNGASDGGPRPADLPALPAVCRPPDLACELQRPSCFATSQHCRQDAKSPSRFHYEPFCMLGCSVCKKVRAKQATGRSVARVGSPRPGLRCRPGLPPPGSGRPSAVSPPPIKTRSALGFSGGIWAPHYNPSSADRVLMGPPRSSASNARPFFGLGLQTELLTRSNWKASQRPSIAG